MNAHDTKHMEDILGGYGTWFTAVLLRLIAKADTTNRERLRLGFPDEVKAYEDWVNNDDDT